MVFHSSDPPNECKCVYADVRHFSCADSCSIYIDFIHACEKWLLLVSGTTGSSIPLDVVMIHDIHGWQISVGLIDLFLVMNDEALLRRNDWLLSFVVLFSCGHTTRLLLAHISYSTYLMFFHVKRKKIQHERIMAQRTQTTERTDIPPWRYNYVNDMFLCMLSPTTAG